MTTTGISEELFTTVGEGIELCYQTFGSPEDEPLLLVMGLGGPMTWWDPEFCQLLADAGFFVIRYDNRDVGRSSRMRGRVTFQQLAMAFVGRPIKAPYSIPDLAGDALGLLDHLGIEAAHVVGISMGGMIAQTMAVTAPERVRSLTSIMSTTGNRKVGWQHPILIPGLLTKVRTKEEYVASGLKMWRLIGSPDYPVSEADLRSRGESTWDRGGSTAGVARQMLAVLTQPDRTKALRQLTVPTTVIHGLADRMVNVSGGRATAKAVPGSQLLLVKGMGHDLPQPLWPTFVGTIRATADRAR
ncbi:alpha/beta fold hydrolase [Nocardioides sp.]|uniref:alpha/beta fold hydrolase n=1 Tax=Nocardioides sp. TaxID=35761 RepID=UPI0039E4D90B